MQYVYLIILIALVQYAALILCVGGMRQSYGVLAPATDGHETWVRLHRIQVNTAEQLVLFAPSLYLFALLVSPFWAALLGCIYLVGRVVYFVTYLHNPDNRIPGAIMTSFTSYILVIGSLIGLFPRLF